MKYALSSTQISTECGGNIKKPLWADLRRADTQNPTCASLDAANDDFYNSSQTPWMQNPGPLGLTDTTGGVHNTCSYPYKLPRGSGKGWGMIINIPIFKAACIQMSRIWDKISLVILKVLISLINFFMKVK